MSNRNRTWKKWRTWTCILDDTIANVQIIFPFSFCAQNALNKENKKQCGKKWICLKCQFPKIPRCFAFALDPFFELYLHFKTKISSITLCDLSLLQISRFDQFQMFSRDRNVLIRLTIFYFQSPSRMCISLYFKYCYLTKDFVFVFVDFLFAFT